MAAPHWRRLISVLRDLFSVKPLGERGENAAAKFLRRRGMKIVARRSRSRVGELDLVAVDGHTLVFVEVKTRASDAKGSAAAAVDERKQRQLTRAALAFLKAKGLLEYPSRFDVVAVTWPQGSRKPQIEHFPNAFEAIGQGQFFS